MAVDKPRIGQEVVYYQVSADHSGQRIDNFLLRELKGVPKSRIYRLLRKGEVRVNKSRIKADYKLQVGDSVRIPPVRVAPAAAAARVSGGLQQRLEAAVLYEDKALLVIDKPSGLAVHGGSGINLGLIEALRSIRPGETSLELVHRLDRDTSGCVMVAKKRSMLKFLHEALQRGTVEKHYLALVQGRWPNRRKMVNLPLAKNVLQSGERMVRVSEEGKRSLTEFAVVERFAGATLVQAKPVTGRTHQIRVHALAAGHPLLGDDKYGTPEGIELCRRWGLQRLFLHAASLQIPLPDSSEVIRVEAALPPELQTVIELMRRDSDGG